MKSLKGEAMFTPSDLKCVILPEDMATCPGSLWGGVVPHLTSETINQLCASNDYCLFNFHRPAVINWSLMRI